MKQKYKFTVDICNKWITNKTVNPLTGRTIEPSAKYGLYKQFVKECSLLKAIKSPNIKERSVTRYYTPPVGIRRMIPQKSFKLYILKLVPKLRKLNIKSVYKSAIIEINNILVFTIKEWSKILQYSMKKNRFVTYPKDIIHYLDDITEDMFSGELAQSAIKVGHRSLKSRQHVLFPISIVDYLTEQILPLNKTVITYMTGVMEYICFELFLSVGKRSQNVTVQSLFEGIYLDNELNETFETLLPYQRYIHWKQ